MARATSAGSAATTSTSTHVSPDSSSTGKTPAAASSTTEASSGATATRSTWVAAQASAPPSSPAMTTAPPPNTPAAASAAMIGMRLRRRVRGSADWELVLPTSICRDLRCCGSGVADGCCRPPDQRSRGRGGCAPPPAPRGPSSCGSRSAPLGRALRLAHVTCLTGVAGTDQHPALARVVQGTLPELDPGVQPPQRPRRPPVRVAGQPHEGRYEHAPHEGRIHDDGQRCAQPHQLDEGDARGREGDEDDGEQQCRGGDEAS